MLTYAFQTLKEQGYKKLETEDFNNTTELFSAILIKGIEKQLKQGLGKEYVEKIEVLPGLRGKINITESIKTQNIYINQLVCSFDEFSINSYQNRILKSTINLLLKSNISKQRKKELKKLLIYFAEVDFIDINQINWNFQFDRNNQTYQMLMSICNLIIKGLLHTNYNGETKLMDFLDEQRLSRLYEKFILEYYKKHFPLLKVSSPYIKWQLDNDMNYMLPTMKSDIVIEYKNDILIIDAKYYSNTLQRNFNKETIHSGNLYQIFTYVKNKSAEFINNDYNVSGMLLYAKTDSEFHPNYDYMMGGNKISVKVLDLYCDFKEIEKQLAQIITENFNIEK